MRVPYAPPGERLLKRSSAARIAGISAMCLWAMAQRGEIDTQPGPGGHRYYRAADVVALRDRLEALEQEAGRER